VNNISDLRKEKINLRIKVPIESVGLNESLNKNNSTSLACV